MAGRLTPAPAGSIRVAPDRRTAGWGRITQANIFRMLKAGAHRYARVSIRDARGVSRNASRYNTATTISRLR